MSPWPWPGPRLPNAVTRFTAELPASFVAIEATYALSILDANGQPLGALAFGEIVQGDRGFASFGVRNDGNTATRLGFRIRTGDGQGDMYLPTARCQLPNRDRPQASALPPEAARELRRAHQAIHEELGEIDTDEERHRHQQFHLELEERIRHLSAEQQDVEAQHRVVGQRIDVPSVASLCFVVAPGRQEQPVLVPPGATVPVVVTLGADPDVAVARHDFTILVDAQDRSPPVR